MGSISIFGTTRRERSNAGYRIARLSLQRALGATLLLSLLFGTPGFAQQPPPELFPNPPVPTQAGPHGLERSLVEVDTEPLTRGLGRLGLQLPDGSSVELVRDGFEARGPGNVAWRGHVASVEDSRAILTVKHGYLAGNIRIGEEEYEIRPSGGRKHIIERLDVESFPTHLHRIPEVDTGAAPSEEGEPGGEGAVTQQDAVADGADQIQLLGTYTPQARAAAGGADQMDAIFQSMVDYGNTAFIDSDMIARFTLVHTAEVSRNDSGDMGADLTWLRASSEVATLRNLYGADMVSLLVKNGGAYCGIAWVMRNPGPGFEDYAFQASDMDCGGGTFNHEHGHNMGFEHDPANGPSPSSASYPWSFGHYLDGNYRTIMSYSNPCSQGCSRVAHFSNPGVTHNGIATGISNERDNARAGDSTAPIVANFREAVITGGNVVRRRIASSSDDVEQAVGGSMLLTSTDMELGDDPSSNGDQTVGLRFINIAIPPGSTIDTADIEFETDETGSTATVVEIRAEATDSAAAFSSAAFNLTSRPTQSESVIWDISAWNTVSEKHWSPDISAIIQQVIDQPGWQENNAIVLVISGSGTRTAESYDGEFANAPLLRIDYTPPGGPPPTNNPPTFNNDPIDGGSVQAGTAYAGSLSGTASDLDGDPLTYSKTSGPSWLAVASGGGLSGTPGAGNVGPNSFTVQASDGKGGTDTATLEIDVTAAPTPNDPPQFTSDPIDGGSVESGQAYAGTLAGSASDPNGDPVSYAKTSGPSWLAVASSGGLSGTPGTGDVGPNGFTVQASDGKGGTDSATLEIDVTAAPVAAIHGGDLDATASGKKNWKATVTVTVHDDSEAPVAGILVSGSWSNGNGGTSSCTTNGSGQCSVDRRTKSPSVDFTLAGLTGAGYSYDSGSNHDTEGDSDGTSITVTKP